MATLMFQLISVLGLLNLTAITIDFLALNILPDRKIYSKLIYDHTHDFDLNRKEK